MTYRAVPGCLARDVFFVLLFFFQTMLYSTRFLFLSLLPTMPYTPIDYSTAIQTEEKYILAISWPKP